LNPEVTVEGFIVELVVEDFTGVGGGRRDDVDDELVVGRVVELCLEIEGELGVVCDESDVGVGRFGLRIHIVAAEDEASHEHGNEDGGDDEGLGANALEVLAACDEPGVRHLR
jgi:hypothetical protein